MSVRAEGRLTVSVMERAGTDAREVYVGLTRHRSKEWEAVERDRPDALYRQRQANPRVQVTEAMALEHRFREARSYGEKAEVVEYAADSVTFVGDGLLKLAERAVPDVRRATRSARPVGPTTVR